MTGRPRTSNQTWKQLLSYLAAGLTIRKAVDMAGINHQVYYNRVESDSEFKMDVENARKTGERIALDTMFKAMKNGDVKAAMWWLERRGGADYEPPATRLQREQSESSATPEDMIKALTKATEQIRKKTEFSAEEGKSEGEEGAQHS